MKLLGRIKPFSIGELCFSFIHFFFFYCATSLKARDLSCSFLLRFAASASRGDAVVSWSHDSAESLATRRVFPRSIQVLRFCRLLIKISLNGFQRARDVWVGVVEGAPARIRNRRPLRRPQLHGRARRHKALRSRSCDGPHKYILYLPSHIVYRSRHRRSITVVVR